MNPQLIYFSVCLLFGLSAVDGLVQGSFQDRAKKYCRLSKQCKVRQEKDYNYRKLMKISDFPSIQPDGYLVKLPFFVMAQRDAHIVFSPIENPNWQRDYVYEILIGGWANNRTLIRRRRQDLDLTVEYTFGVLRKDDPLKIEILITTGGDIKVFIEYQKEPLAIAHDDNPLQIKYFGFASYHNSWATYYYDCPGENLYDEPTLAKNCNYDQVSENEYKDFYAISDIEGIRPEGFLIRFPLFIKAGKDAHILLSPFNRDDRSDEVYEILIGGWANTRVIIRRKQGDDVLRDVEVVDVLSKDKYTVFLVEITDSGDIKIFSRDGLRPFKLVTGATDPNPIKVQYISFGSYLGTKVQTYFNCSLPIAPPDVAHANPDHPLLINNVPKALDLRNFLVTKCNFYESSEYVYRNYLDLTELRGAQPEGYLARLVFYVQGSTDASVIFTTTKTPNLEKDTVYEFIIGAHGNTRVIIRRKYFASLPLTEVFENNILSDKKPTKFLIEIAKSGNIRVYSENYKTQPIASAFDKNLIPVRYVSFAAFEQNRNEYFYNCKHIDTNLAA